MNPPEAPDPASVGVSRAERALMMIAITLMIMMCAVVFAPVPQGYRMGLSVLTLGLVGAAQISRLVRMARAPHPVPRWDVVLTVALLTAMTACTIGAVTESWWGYGVAAAITVPAMVWLWVDTRRDIRRLEEVEAELRRLYGMPED